MIDAVALYDICVVLGLTAFCGVVRLWTEDAP